MWMATKMEWNEKTEKNTLKLLRKCYTNVDEHERDMKLNRLVCFL